LVEELRGLVTRFNFNRLCQVGGGASLEIPDKQAYERFLQAYLKQGVDNPMMGFKDNLFNLLRERAGRPLFGGCTGHGCGAAFNFVALLPDGEVHACRKLPSRLGNIGQQSLEEIYDSALAQSYRAGPSECAVCELKDKCRGCMAVAFGAGLRPLNDRDPHCFRST
jgi:radical SAM protein with 4Fe4S-binding SPASM domain